MDSDNLQEKRYSINGLRGSIRDNDNKPPQEILNLIQPKLAAAQAAIDEKKRRDEEEKKRIEESRIKITDKEFRKTITKKSRYWHLYHSYKNENALIPVIVISFLVFFIPMGFMWTISVWLWYYLYCEYNNGMLDQDPLTLQRRASAKRIYENELNEKNNKSCNNKRIQDTYQKVSYYDPCPCGSGKKYKQCCARELYKKSYFNK